MLGAGLAASAYLQTATSAVVSTQRKIPEFRGIFDAISRLRAVDLEPCVPVPPSNLGGE